MCVVYGVVWLGVGIKQKFLRTKILFHYYFHGKLFIQICEEMSKNVLCVLTRLYYVKKAKCILV